MFLIPSSSLRFSNTFPFSLRFLIPKTTFIQQTKIPN
jgi:hypothetical protein